MDEYDPETKNGKMSKPEVKIMLVVFYDAKSVADKEFVLNDRPSMLTTIMPQPPHNLDLLTADFFLFHRIRTAFKGK